MRLIAFRQAGTADTDRAVLPDIEEWRDGQWCVGIRTLPPLERKHLPCLGGHHEHQTRTGNPCGSRTKFLAVEPDLPVLRSAVPDENPEPSAKICAGLMAGLASFPDRESASAP